MAERPIPIALDLQQLLKLPDCDLISLPKPAPAKIRIPGGTTLTAFTDISKGIPTDCSMAFSLTLQLAPMLASIECLVKVLALLKPLIDIIQGLAKVPPSPPSPKLLADFAKAAKGVIECATGWLPGAGLLAFIKDILLLIIAFLKCFIGQMQTLIGMLSGLSLQIGQAEAAGNAELKRVLECAHQNAMTSADHLQGAIGPVMNLVDLVGPLLSLAGIDVAVPAIVPGADLDGLKKTLQSLKDVVTLLGEIADGIPV